MIGQHRIATMINDIPVREPYQIRHESARILRAVKVSDHFETIFRCQLGED